MVEIWVANPHSSGSTRQMELTSQKNLPGALCPGFRRIRLKWIASIPSLRLFLFTGGHVTVLVWDPAFNIGAVNASWIRLPLHLSMNTAISERMPRQSGVPFTVRTFNAVRLVCSGRDPKF